MTPGPLSERALVLVPAEGGEEALSVIARAGLAVEACDDLDALADRLTEGAGLAIIADEALTGAGLVRLFDWIARQPAWSDFPIVLLAGQDRTPPGDVVARLGNVVILERPFSGAALVATVRSVIRGRRRQYEARQRIEDLHQREALLRVAQEAGGVGVFEVLPDSGEIIGSRVFRQLWGIHHDGPLFAGELAGRLHEEHRHLAVQTADGAMPAHGMDYVEYRIDPFDGAPPRWLARRGQTMVDPRTGARHFYGATYDITARRAAEDRLRTNEATLRSLNQQLEGEIDARTRERDRIWEVSRDLLAVWNVEGVFAGINPAWETTLGWRPDDLIGRTLVDLIHPDDREQSFAQVGRALRGRGQHTIENRTLCRDGSYRRIGWMIARDRDLIYTVGRDVTEERQRQADLERTQDALRQAQKMEAVGQLTGGIAHDFNNLLTGILGGLDIVRRRIADGRLGDVDRFIDAASTSATRAASLVHRLLAFSRRQSLNVQSTDVDGLIRSMEDLLLRTFGAQVRLHLALDADPWLAETDANQLENAILNLAINARDAMPEGGDLTIATTLRVIPESGDGELGPGEYVEIRVTDTGTGIPPELLERVFDPFFTTKPIGQGTGLGLSMIYGFARQSRGRVEIESAVGRGTTVRILLPIGREAVESAPARPETETAPRALPGETVLVVEDDPGVRQLVVEVLTELGYGAIEADAAEPAVPLLRSPTRIDLLVTDVGLPGMDGRELADLALEARPDLRVLFITGYAEKAALRGGFLAPGMDMIAKPFALDALAGKLREMIGAA